MVARHTLLAVLLTLVFFTLSCGDDGGDEPPPSGEFTTFNVGLARGFVDYAKERMTPAATAISETETDVVCLQEVWLYQDENDEWADGQVQAIIDASSETFPHTYWERTMPEEAEEEEEMMMDETACSEEEAGPLRSCAEENCGDVAAGELSDCVLANCGDEFNATSSACQGCMIANLGKPLDDIIDACLAGGSSGIAYDGHNGLLLLSKHELKSTEFTDFEAELVHRSALHAVVAHPDLGDVDVYCTHLTADLGDSVEYPEGGTYSSYAEEQAAQIDALIQWVDDTQTSDATVVMGDMNTGPAVADWNAEHPDNYQKFIDSGLGNGYVDSEAPDCTYCLANALNGGETNEGKIIDHTFHGPAFEATGATRVLDETQSIETSDGEKELPLSDHYGVTVTVEKP